MVHDESEEKWLRGSKVSALTFQKLLTATLNTEWWKHSSWIERKALVVVAQLYAVSTSSGSFSSGIGQEQWRDKVWCFVSAVLESKNKKNKPQEPSFIDSCPGFKIQTFHFICAWSLLFNLLHGITATLFVVLKWHWQSWRRLWLIGHDSDADSGKHWLTFQLAWRSYWWEGNRTYRVTSTPEMTPQIVTDFFSQ